MQEFKKYKEEYKKEQRNTRRNTRFENIKKRDFLNLIIRQKA